MGSRTVSSLVCFTCSLRSLKSNANETSRTLGVCFMLEYDNNIGYEVRSIELPLG